MNKVFLTGRLTADAELRTTTSGKSVTTFSLAVNDGFGEKQKAYFFNVVVWGKGAEAVANYTHKGSKVAVTGKLTSRSYDDKNGNKRTAIEVVADMMGGVEFLDSKNGNQGNGDYTYRSGQDVSEEEIPF
jgi:single-strand DNA-binding protein